jgi:hypothetical protein
MRKEFILLISVLIATLFGFYTGIEYRKLEVNHLSRHLERTHIQLGQCQEELKIIKTILRYKQYKEVEKALEVKNNSKRRK